MNKMMFDEFKDVVVNEIKEFLPERFTEVNLQTVKKNNNKELSGLIIRSAESNICPTIYLEQFYEEYKKCGDMGKILAKIAQVRIEHEVPEQFEVKQITEFEQVRGQIVPRIVNTGMNAELLESRPHKMIADLAITYYVVLKNSDEGSATVAVTNELMSIWDITKEELHDIAIANIPSILPSTFKGMTEVMSEMMGMKKEDMEMMGMPTAEEQMYVLSNKTKLNGTSALLDKKMMEAIVAAIGEFYVLPSSIHEVLIVPAKSGMSVKDLEFMVCEVNATEVAPDEVLSNHVYVYSLKEGLSLAA